MKSGFVAVVGRPNVGKSTLVNRLVGSKVSITSSRPQTTRNVIRGVMTSPDGAEPPYQAVLVDTPGLHKPRTELGSRLNAMVAGTLADADAAIFVIDATMPVGAGDRLIADRLNALRDRVLLVVNKVDRADRGRVIGQLAAAEAWDFHAYHPVSALVGSGVAEVAADLVSLLPEGPRYYPEGVLTDQPESLVVAELIRERFLERLRDELPHSLLVRVESIEERPGGMVDVAANVVVERKSQKGIVIGKGGSLLKLAGSEARAELEAKFGAQVALDLHVVVERDWQQRPQLLDRLGFEV